MGCVAEYSTSGRSMASGHPYKTTSMTGVADSKLVTGSFWLKLVSPVANRGIYQTHTAWPYQTDNGFTIFYDTTPYDGGHSNPVIAIRASNASNSWILQCETADEGVSPFTSWTHVCFSFDMADTGKRHIYVGDSSSAYYNTYTNDTIDFTKGGHAIGGAINTTESYRQTGLRISEFWLDDGRYVDFSTESNRRKFISGGGKAVDLGSDGSTPFGASPTIYYKGDHDTTNAGSGENFTEGGTINAASDSPDGAGPGSTGKVAGVATSNIILINEVEADGTSKIICPTSNGFSVFDYGTGSFDGSTDGYTKSAVMTGAADSKLFTFSFWIKPANDTPGGAADVLFNARDSSGNPELSMWQYSTSFDIQVKNSSGTKQFRAETDSELTQNAWHHVIMSVDLSDTGKRHFLIDGSSPTSLVWDTYNNYTIDFSSYDRWYIANAVSSNWWGGCMSELWFEDGYYIDLSVTANLEKFIKNGSPVYLGSDGSRVNGTAPLIYLTQDGENWGTSNQGTGGNYTENGTVTSCSDEP